MNTEKKETKIVTNEELQRALSERIRGLEYGTTEPSHARTYFVGAKALLTSVKMDVEAARTLGITPFRRTQEFFGIRE